MAKERTFAQILADRHDLFGIRIEGKSAQIKKLATRVNHQNRYDVVLMDCSADIQATVSPADVANLRDGMVVIVDFVVLNHGTDGVLLKVSSIREAKEGEFKQSDLDAPGIGEEVVNACKANLAKVIKLLRHDGYRQLVWACLTSENIEKMSKVPATLDRQGRFPGGALVQTSVVSVLVYYTMAVIWELRNGIHTRGYNSDALITAALLHQFGVLEFFKEHNGTVRKTQVGLNYGYFLTLERTLTRIVAENGIPLTELELSALFNILGSADRKIRGLRAVSKEGEVLSCAISTYERLDIFDAEYQRLSKLNLELELDKREEYSYSELLECQIFIQYMTDKEIEEQAFKKEQERKEAEGGES